MKIIFLMVLVLITSCSPRDCSKISPNSLFVGEIARHIKAGEEVRVVSALKRPGRCTISSYRIRFNDFAEIYVDAHELERIK